MKYPENTNFQGGEGRGGEGRGGEGRGGVKGKPGNQLV